MSDRPIRHNCSVSCTSDQDDEDVIFNFRICHHPPTHGQIFPVLLPKHCTGQPSHRHAVTSRCWAPTPPQLSQQRRNVMHHVANDRINATQSLLLLKRHRHHKNIIAATTPMAPSSAAVPHPLAVSCMNCRRSSSSFAQGTPPRQAQQPQRSRSRTGTATATATVPPASLYPQKGCGLSANGHGGSGGYYLHHGAEF